MKLLKTPFWQYAFGKRIVGILKSPKEIFGQIQPKKFIFFIFSLCLFLASCISPSGGTSYRPYRMQTIQEVPEDKVPITLIWMISPHHNLDEVFNLLKELFGQYPSFRLVTAFPSESLNLLTQAQKARLVEWLNEGRLEIGLIPYGGLPVPMLIKFSWHLRNSFGIHPSLLRGAPGSILKPQEALQIFIRSAESWKKNFPDMAMPGFVLPLGLADEETLNGVSAGEAPWAVVSATGTDQAFTSSGGIRLYAAHALMNTWPPQEILEERPKEDERNFQRWSQRGKIYVLDENYILSGEETTHLLKRIALDQEGRFARFSMVRLSIWFDVLEALSSVKRDNQNPKKSFPDLNRETSRNISIFPHWGPLESVNFLWGSSAQGYYWSLMSRLNQDIAGYQNSGKAKLQKLDELWEEFFSILSYSRLWGFRESMRFTTEGELYEQEFRAQLTQMYQKMAKIFLVRLPPGLRVSLWSEETKKSRAGSGFTQGESSLESDESHFEFLDAYDNSPEGASFPNLRKFSSTWSDQSLDFMVSLSTPISGSYVAEIYIDLNRRPYEGKGESFSGSLRAASVDFWEYLIRIDALGEISLYRYQSEGSIRLIKRVAAGASNQFKYFMKQGELFLQIPRSWIAGKDPKRWGWAVCLWGNPSLAAAEDLSKSSSKPFSHDCLQIDASDSETLFFNRMQ